MCHKKMQILLIHWRVLSSIILRDYYRSHFRNLNIKIKKNYLYFYVSFITKKKQLQKKVLLVR